MRRPLPVGSIPKRTTGLPVRETQTNTNAVVRAYGGLSFRLVLLPLPTVAQDNKYSCSKPKRLFSCPEVAKPNSGLPYIIQVTVSFLDVSPSHLAVAMT
jgi:hypothetical protein